MAGLVRVEGGEDSGQCQGSAGEREVEHEDGLGAGDDDGGDEVKHEDGLDDGDDVNHEDGNGAGVDEVMKTLMMATNLNVTTET